MREAVLEGHDLELRATVPVDLDIKEASWGLEEKLGRGRDEGIGGHNWTAIIDITVTGETEGDMEQAVVDATETITDHYRTWGYEEIYWDPMEVL